MTNTRKYHLITTALTVAFLSAVSLLFFDQIITSAFEVFIFTTACGLALWMLIGCFWEYPDPMKTDDLYHFTDNWDAIKSSSHLYPTADGRIYLIDRNENLGGALTLASLSRKFSAILCRTNAKTEQKNQKPIEHKLVFTDAKKCNVAKFKAHPFNWLRFKQGRGEWGGDTYKCLRINSYQESASSNEVIISDFQFVDPSQKAASYLRARIVAAKILLSIPLMSVAFGYFAAQLVFFQNKLPIYKMSSAWILAFWIIVFLIGYKIQSNFNKKVFLIMPNK